MRKYILCASMISVFLFTAVQIEAVETTVFEKTYVRGTGKPITKTDTFTGNEGTATIKVNNGGLDDTDTEMVSSAEITLNGTVIIDESDFNQNVDVIEVENELSEGNNTIEVTLNGKPGGTLTVQLLVESLSEIHITFPTDGSTVNSSNTIVTGTIDTSAQESGVTVNGVLAEVSGSEFVANDISLEIGENTLTVVLKDKNGNTATDTITVHTDEYQDFVSMSSNITSCTPPFTIYFQIDTNISSPITTYQMDFDGDGTIDYTDTNADDVSFTYDLEGFYYAKAIVTDDQGDQYTDTIVITVLSLDEVAILLRDKWNEMSAALIAGDTDTALSYFVAASRERFNNTLAELGSTKINSLFSNITTIIMKNADERVANCWAVREETGGPYAYPITFVKDGNGLWKIMGF